MTLNLTRIWKTKVFARQALDLIAEQQRILQYQQEEMNRQRLAYIQEMHALVSAWILSIEQPEIDLRADLVELEATLGNQVAKIEEHVL